MSTETKKRLPDFIIIGAMKCMTSTLHDQLALQDGIFMSSPKEPFFFSDDHVFAKGNDWYSSLFDSASTSDICGESSTHYTKLPTYPDTITRMLDLIPDVKIIYVMRNPIDRLVSQYIHEWTQGNVRCSIDDAINQCPELINYSKYAYQIAPYAKAVGLSRILPVFFERVKANPQTEIERICKFICYQGNPEWSFSDHQKNRSAERLKKSRVRDILLDVPVLKIIRQKIVPQHFRDRVKSFWQMKEKPQLSSANKLALKNTFDLDLAVLGKWLGRELRCDCFEDLVKSETLEWTEQYLQTLGETPLFDGITV